MSDLGNDHRARVSFHFLKHQFKLPALKGRNVTESALEKSYRLLSDSRAPLSTHQYNDVPFTSVTKTESTVSIYNDADDANHIITTGMFILCYHSIPLPAMREELA